MKTHAVMDSPIGELTLVNMGGTLSALYMEVHARRPEASALGERSATGFEQATEELNEYFRGERRYFAVATEASGTAFQERVWKLLREIPYGETRTYAQLADALGDRKAIRAVGTANGRNPLSIIVPCHRVVGSDGSLTGFAGGLERKEYLLGLENLARQKALF
ncbi:methylated-DNA--[protein]-cysteine S-methyltransferase [Arthrobacter roseus]|uniref:methylated-DNA--[protein]-cysteine S-methyltransferase n=1 Tax=Arthrobacter roseus TaxID=136274 RepID=UPI001965B183|nr:methylated-DNA--[protein]-cysteine S-methyltransferase [Arthrobacter roseus]MBM7846946.1 methylated-DNA-[protein]-cysteine S-methyltransferase [Arthrobacter roseus]